MTFFVYISDACAADAQQFGVTDHLAELALTIERDQAFWQLETFEYPFSVNKRLCNRHKRTTVEEMVLAAATTAQTAQGESKQCEPRTCKKPQNTAIPAHTSTALPKLHQPAKLPKTELVWGDYRLTFMRVQQRLNIVHQLTGEFGSVFVQQARVSGDWALQPLAADAYQLLSTPFVLYLPTALRTYCVVEVAAHGLQLVLR